MGQSKKFQDKIASLDLLNSAGEKPSKMYKNVNNMNKI
jgi:hypothetical protein